MGGVPVLMLVAAIGVTYGWQSDGDRGVEYIIQVPADQLARLQQTGEISSRIDPEVQGHVSRVVIRVGNGPLPRSTPTTIARSNHNQPQRSTAAQDVETRPLAAAGTGDQDLVPIPEMRESSPPHPIGPLPSLAAADSASDSGIAAMMKPDAGDPLSGSGISLPPSLRESANAVRDNLLQSGTAAADALKSSFAVPGSASSPESRESRNNEPPSFTGGPTMAGPTMGAPTMGAPTTDPADVSGNARSAPWYESNRNMPSSPTGNIQSSQASSVPRANDAVGLGTTSNFGRPPTSQEQPQSGPLPSRNSDFSNGTGNTSDPMSTYAFQQQESQRQQDLERQQELRRQQDLERQRAYQRQLAEQQQANDRLTPSPAPTYGQSFTPEPDRSLGFGSPNYSQTPPGFTSSTPAYSAVDPKLTVREIDLLPPGAYSFNVYGQPIDREGRILDHYGRIAATQTQPPTRAPEPSPPAYHSPSDRVPSDRVSSDPIAQPAPISGSASEYSPSDRYEKQPRSESSNRVMIEPRKVAAQPLFNGMLLISIIGNLYLAFWLKNLRNQFRDLVAARRTNSASTSSPA